MLKEIDTEETIRLLCHIFIIMAFQLGEGVGARYAYEPKCCTQFNDM